MNRIPFCIFILSSVRRSSGASGGHQALNSCCLTVMQVVEAGLGFLPFSERTVITPAGRPYVGVDFARKLCGVSASLFCGSMQPWVGQGCSGLTRQPSNAVDAA